MVEVKLTHSGIPATTLSPHSHSDLALPNNSTVGQTQTEELRRILGPLIPNAHTINRYQLVSDYAAALKAVLDAGGNVEEWWQSKREQS